MLSSSLEALSLQGVSPYDRHTQRLSPNSPSTVWISPSSSEDSSSDSMSPQLHSWKGRTRPDVGLLQQPHLTSSPFPTSTAVTQEVVKASLALSGSCIFQCWGEDSHSKPGAQGADVLCLQKSRVRGQHNLSSTAWNAEPQSKTNKEMKVVVPQGWSLLPPAAKRSRCRLCITRIFPKDFCTGACCSVTKPFFPARPLGHSWEQSHRSVHKLPAEWSYHMVSILK